MSGPQQQPAASWEMTRRQCGKKHQDTLSVISVVCFQPSLSQVKFEDLKFGFMLCVHSVRLYQTSTRKSTATVWHLSLQSSNLPGDVQFSPSQRLTHSDAVHGGATRRRKATWAAPRPAECSAPSLCGAQVLFVAGPEISNHLVNICKPSK